MKKLKVFGYVWHVPHQYEIAKLPFVGEYHLIHHPFKTWDESGRPIPENVKFVTEYDEKEKYDLAILHLDQQCVEPRIAKGRVITEIINKINCPKVVINHQTPFSDRLTVDEVIRKVKYVIKDTPMVVNSKKSREQWGWGYPIIHGMESAEWKVLPKEPRAITVLTRAGMERAYQRNFLYATRERLHDEGIPFTWVGVDRGRLPSFEEYTDYLGRSLVFLNGTVNSPMPRSRTEAMLSGCCIVTLRHHDIADYIEDGVNGFIIPRNPESAVKLIKELLTNRYHEAVQVGMRGRETALKEFSSDKFAQQWEVFLTKIYPGLL